MRGQVLCSLSEGTYVYVDAVQRENLGRRGLLRHVAVELLVTPVPLDCVQLLLLQVVVTAEPDRFARRNCLWYSDLHSAQPAGTCKQQSVDFRTKTIKMFYDYEYDDYLFRNLKFYSLIENYQRFELKYRIVLQGRITWESLNCINIHCHNLSYTCCADIILT